MTSTLRNYTYYCVSCGEEISPHEVGSKTMVSLSYAALDGVNEQTIIRTPVYVTRKELEELIEQKDDSGRQYLTLRQYLEFAYNDVNNSMLDGTTKEETAQDAFVKWQRTTYQENSASAFDDSGKDDLIEDDGEDQEIIIPGFNETVSAQIIKNFPRGKCYLKWEINPTKGYTFCLTEKHGAFNRITPYWVCTKCKDEILSCAFECRHILIGLLGFASVGKTCLIAALCHALIRDGGQLRIISEVHKEYELLLKDFAGGYTVAKTERDGHNTYHPSVQTGDLLWTFVDIPGEVFYSPGQHNIDAGALVRDPRMQMSLKCHFFILATDTKTAGDILEIGNTQTAFDGFINFSERYAHRIEGAPLMFALNKIDEEIQEHNPNLPNYCIKDGYPRQYKKELSRVRNTGFTNLLDALSTRGYIFAVTCAPYGFPPLPADNPASGKYPTREQKEEWIKNFKHENPLTPEDAIPHPVYRELQSRNVDLIIDWMKKLFGIEKIPLDQENHHFIKHDISQLSRQDCHYEDDLVSAIAYMFCNPNEVDAQSFADIGDSSLWKLIKRKYKTFKERQLSKGK